MADQNTHFNIFQELQEWSKSLEAWEKLALLKLVEKTKIDPVDIKLIFEEFCFDKELKVVNRKRESYGLQLNAAVPQQVSATPSTPIHLSQIKNVKGVNAIAEKQELNLGKHLTVVYGSNGSGKSGYARILKSACFTRSPNTKIYGNVNYSKDKLISPQATFTFSDGSIENFKEVKSEKLRDNFAVFDSSCIRIYTDTSKNFTVIPYGFDVFPGFVDVINAIKESIDSEIKARTPDLIGFQVKGTSEIAIERNKLCSKTDLNRLARLGKFGADDSERLKNIPDELIRLYRKNTEDLIKGKLGLGKEIKGLLHRIKNISDKFNAENLKKIETKILEINELRTKVAASTAAQFKGEPVQPVGTRAWVSLIEAAIQYNQEAHCDKDEKCLLCHQILTVPAKERLAKFYSYVKSESEKSLRTKEALLEKMKLEFKSLDLSFFSKETAVYIDIKNWDQSVANKFEESIARLQECKKSILENIQICQWNEIPKIECEAQAAFPLVRKTLASEVRNLKKENVAKQIHMLNAELESLKERKDLSEILPKITNAVENLKWIEKAKSARQSLANNQGNVTKKRTALYSKLVGGGYEKLFFDECAELEVKLPIKIKISGNDAITQRNMLIGAQSASAPQPSEILSEGEQTAVALADFLAEVALNDNPINIIFDDPVSSLDHIRKEAIAKRLTREATKRQIIIFTHDIMFVYFLAEFAQKLGAHQVTFKDCTVSVNLEGVPGCINQTVFPYLFHEKHAEDRINKHLTSAKAKIGSEQLGELKLGIGVLRAAYENFIQTALFKDIIRRWRENIHATGLLKVYWDEETASKVVDKYETLSRYIEGHLNSPGFTGKPLTCDYLEEELRDFRNIKNTYNKKADQYEKDLKEKKDRVFI